MFSCVKVGQHRYKCVCKEGYIRDSRHPDGPCIVPGCHNPECNPDTQDCRELHLGFFRCVCKDGFVFRGGECVPYGNSY